MDLSSLVQGLAQQALAGNNAVPAAQQNSVAQGISGSILDGLKNQVASGNITDLINIFSKQPTTVGNPAMNGIQGMVTNVVCEKLGINPATAAPIVSAVLPMIMNSLSKKAADPKDNSIDFNGLFQSVGGGQGMDLNGIMSRLDDDDDGFGLDDAAQLLSGSGGVGGVLGKLFG